MRYKPNPEKIDNVELPQDIVDLIESLAKNTHEVWAATRMKEGWRYGKERNDEKKEHPCLIPYNKLPETEKEIDRKVATDILKLIKKLGYTVDRIDDEN